MLVPVRTFNFFLVVCVFVGFITYKGISDSVDIVDPSPKISKIINQCKGRESLVSDYTVIGSNFLYNTS